MRSSNILMWVLSAIGIVALLVVAPLTVLLPVGLLLGGAAAGTAFLIVSLIFGDQGAGAYDQSLYWIPAALSSALAIFAAVRSGIRFFRTAELPPILTSSAEGFKHLVTLHLAVQVGLGATSAVVGILAKEGSSAMSTSEALVITLFSIFVFIVSATFTSFFMRSLIPWRHESPRFSNAVAYALSTLLGLIAGTYAFAGKNTFGDASHIGAMLYQASVAIGTIGATAVGAYVAVTERKNGSSDRGGDSGSGT
jgi:hypothetical protein